MSSIYMFIGCLLRVNILQRADAADHILFTSLKLLKTPFPYTSFLPFTCAPLPKDKPTFSINTMLSKDNL
jgi:hypothetical protein